MVILKSLILSAFIFFQIVQSFCIYNGLTNGSIRVVQEPLVGIPQARTFRKVIRPGLSECCPYTDRDCSLNRTKDTVTNFSLVFIWDHLQRTGYHTVRCTTGGGLTIHGNEENQFAVCQDAFGAKTDVSIVPIDKLF